MASEDVKTEEDISKYPSPLEQKIIRQIEYYFGDVNLPRDKFLKEKIQEDDGWITLECLTTFNRLKNLSTDLMEIANALKKSQTNLLEIHESNLKIRRSVNKPLPDMADPMLRKASKMKTLYMKGFPESFELDDIQDFISKQEVNSIFVKLRRTKEQKFKGSIFLELQTQEEADKLLNNKELKCGETLLIVKSRDDYFKEKHDERHKQKDSDEKIKKEREEPAEPVKLARKAKSVLHFDGVGEETSRETLKSVFGKSESISWVDFNRGETQGFIRFNEEGGAERAIEALKKENDGKILLEEVETKVRVLEGDEAENYWKMTEEDMRKARERSGRGRGQGRGRGFGRKKVREGARDFVKRRRPWEDKRSDDFKTTDSDKKLNEHKRFDSNGEDEKTEIKTEGGAMEAKKSNVEDGATEAKKLKIVDDGVTEAKKSEVDEDGATEAKKSKVEDDGATEAKKSKVENEV